MATADGFLVTEQIDEGGPRTTHIVIHDQTLEESLKTPATPITPATPSTGKGESKFRYQWDDSVHLPVLPVRCKNTNGELHKSRFGSGKLRVHTVRMILREYFCCIEFSSFKLRILYQPLLCNRWK